MASFHIFTGSKLFLRGKSLKNFLPLFSHKIVVAEKSLSQKVPTFLVQIAVLGRVHLETGNHQSLFSGTDHSRKEKSSFDFEDQYVPRILKKRSCRLMFVDLEIAIIEFDI